MHGVKLQEVLSGLEESDIELTISKYPSRLKTAYCAPKWSSYKAGGDHFCMKREKWPIQ